MSNTNATEQPTPKLNPDFSHRLACTSWSSDQSMTDSIGLMSARAKGVLHLLLLQFEPGSAKLSDESMCGAIDSVMNEIEDIEAVVYAFYEAESAKKRA